MKRGLALILLTLAGCSTESAPEIETTDGLLTSDLVLAVTAQGNGEAILVSAGLTAAGGGARVLADGERLSISAKDAPEHALSAYDQSGYLALLPTKESRVTLTFVRPSEQVSADVDLPPPFALTVPPAVSANAAVPLSWEAADTGDAMTLSVSGSCVSPLSRSLAADTGSYDLQPGDLAFSDGGCEISVSLSRSRAAVSLGLGSSSSAVTSAQVRTAAIEVTP